MARKGKWVEIKSSDEPLADVARRTLADRLRLVWRYLQRSHDGSPSDVENVHQLRVSTRRAVAAMEVFENLLPPRRAEWMTKQLKRVRQAAGNARDLDVMLDRFRHLAEHEVDGPYGAMVHWLKVRRHRAQDPVDTAFEKLERKHFQRRFEGLAKRVRLRNKNDRFNEPSIADGARSRLALVVADFFQAGDADFTEYAVLHAFRIAGKRLRYAMEIFAAAFPASFRDDLYPLVAALQERLGEVGDHATAHEQFSAWLTEDELDSQSRVAIESLVGEEQRALEAKCREFVDWWRGEPKEDLRRRFAEALDLPDLAIKPELALRRAE
jgi:CHAD domain-containing protein